MGRRRRLKGSLTQRPQGPLSLQQPCLGRRPSGTLLRAPGTVEDQQPFSGFGTRPLRLLLRSPRAVSSSGSGARGTGSIPRRHPLRALVGREDPAPERRLCPPFPDAFPACWLAAAPPAVPGRPCWVVGCSLRRPPPTPSWRATLTVMGSRATTQNLGLRQPHPCKYGRGRACCREGSPGLQGRQGAEPACSRWEHCGRGELGALGPSSRRALDKPAPDRGLTWVSQTASWCQWARDVLPDPLGRPP